MLTLDQVTRHLPQALRECIADPSVTEVMLNGPDSAWAERGGKLYRVESGGLTERRIKSTAVAMARPLGFELTGRAPLVDARLEDGSRVAIAIPPAARGVTITVRRFGGRAWTVGELVEAGSLPPEVAAMAATEIEGKAGNVLVSGSTGAGKTTLLQALATGIPRNDRVVVIEDTAELSLDVRNCVRFEARGLEGGVTIRDLVRHSLRHRPDRLVVGEVRGGEALDMLQALATGHGGSFSTIHSADAEGALHRLAALGMLGGGGAFPWEVVCEMVAQAITLVVHVARREDGSRGVAEAVAVEGYDHAGGRWNTRVRWPE